MCRNKDVRPDRCPCSSPERRSASDRAYYASRKASGVTSPPKDGGGIALLETPTATDQIHEAVNLARQYYSPTKINTAGLGVREQMEAHEALQDAINDKYGSAEGAVRAAGEILAAKGEEYAGVTALQVQQAWEQRDAEIRARVDEAKGRGEVLLKEYKDAHAKIYAAAIELKNSGASRETITAEQEKLIENSRKALAAYNTYQQNVLSPLATEYTSVHFGYDEQTKADHRRLSDGYLKALGEVRELGGEQMNFNPKSTKAAAATFNEVAQIFPKSWIEASNARSLPVAKVQKSRAHYSDGVHHEKKKKVRSSSLSILEPGEVPVDTYRYSYEKVEGEDKNLWRKLNFDTGTSRGSEYQTPPKGGWELYEHKNGTNYWRKPRYRMELVASEYAPEIKTNSKPELAAGKGPLFATTAHELSHRWESSVPGIKAMEDDFVTRRTTTNGARDKLVDLGGKMKGEKTRPDSFANAYIGKEYNDGSREALSCGVEALFAGRYGGLVGTSGSKPDHEMRSFILGVLATAE